MKSFDQYWNDPRRPDPSAESAWNHCVEHYEEAIRNLEQAHRLRVEVLMRRSDETRRDLDRITHEIIGGAGDIFLLTLADQIRTRHGMNRGPG